MIKKIMSMVAVAAFVLTIAVQAMSARSAQTFIWQYTDGSSETAFSPLCNELPGICAYKYHYDPNAPDGLGEPVMIEEGGELVHDYLEGQRIL